MQTSQSVELVRQLLIHGADPNNAVQKSIPFGFNIAKNVHHGLGKEILFHYSPLHIALGSKEWDIAMLLIDFGADTTCKKCSWRNRATPYDATSFSIFFQKE